MTNSNTNSPGVPAPTASPSREASLERVRASLHGLDFEELPARDGMPSIRVTPEVLHDALRGLRDRGAYAQVSFVTAVDRSPREPRFEVVHQLLSFLNNDRLRVVTPVASEDPSVPSCVDLWPGAAFMERECWDMFGVRFEGSPDHRRLLMPEEYGHHPLRKEFPHEGIEPDRLYREWDRERRAEEGGA